MTLSDDELLGLIDLLNSWADSLMADGAELQLEHKNTGRTAPLLPLLRKLLKEAMTRKLLTPPPCFRPIGEA